MLPTILTIHCHSCYIWNIIHAIKFYYGAARTLTTFNYCHFSLRLFSLFRPILQLSSAYSILLHAKMEITLPSVKFNSLFQHFWRIYLHTHSIVRDRWTRWWAFGISQYRWCDIMTLFCGVNIWCLMVLVPLVLVSKF